jgi:PAS domain S-box-containing protein
VARKQPGKEKFKAPPKDSPKITRPPSSRVLYLVMALVAVAILVGGYLFYRDQEQQMRQRIEGGLSIMAQLKADQITEWRAERLMDANMLAGSPFFAEGVAKYLASPTDTEAKDKVLARLAIIAKSYPYQDILLTDVNGSVLLSLNDSVLRLSDMTLSQLAVAIKEHKAVITDFHYPPDSDSPHLGVVAPLFPWGQDSQPATGAVVFCIDPSQYLYPLLQSSPMPSETAETLLVERDGDQVLFLSDLRHQKDTALKLRIPLSQQEVPAVMAVLGKEGVVEGRDYRGVEVLAALEHIPDSPWYMVAKIDTSEAISASRFRVGIIIASVTGFLAAALAVIGLIWQRRQRLAYQVLYQAELESQALRRHFEYLVKYANDIILLVDENQHIVEVNDRALETYGYTRQEMLGMPLAALIPPGDLPSHQARLRKIQQKGTIVAEAIHQRKDGSTFPVEVSGRTIKIEDKTYLQEIIRDITERKAREEEYRVIIRTAIDGFWIADMQGHFLDANEAYCHLTGYSRDELLNMSIPDVEALEKPEETAERIQKIKEVGYDRFESRHRRKDGEVVDVEVSVNYLPIDSGQMFVFIRDITERMEAEESLRLSEQNFRDSIENSPFGIRIVGEDGKILYANQALLDIYGYSSLEELEAVPSKQRYTPESYVEHRGRVKKRKLGEYVPPSYGISIVRKDGDVRHLTVSRGEVLWDGEKQFQVVYQDITERKQAEGEVQEERRKLKEAQTMGKIGNWEYDVDSQAIIWSDEVYVLYERDPALGPPNAEEEAKYYSADQARTLRDYAARSIENGEEFRYDLEAILPSGKRAVFAASMDPIINESGRVIKLFGTVQDITERKQAEERYRILFDTNIDGLCVMDETMKVLLVNEATARIFGFESAEEVLEVNPFDFIPSQERERVLETITKDMFENDKKQANEFQLVNKAGKEVWISAVGAVVEYQGKPAGLISFRDITERKRAEEALRQSEEKHRTILEEMDEGYYEQDLASNLTFVNDSMSRLLGYSREELIGMDYRVYVPAHDVKRRYEAWNKVYRTGKPLRWISLGNIRKDGTLRFVEDSVLPLRNDKGEIIGFRGVSHDVTQRKQAEEERRQLEQKAQVTSRLASVGEMAAGVAHEINNPLTGVIGYAQLLMDRGDIPSDIRSDLAAINDGAQRVASIVKRLLVFSRQVKPERRDVDINELIESTLALRAYHLRVNNIKVTIQLAPDLPETVADPGQIQQVLLNLIVNAETEMKLARGKGKLLIKTEKVDNTIRISFKDNGPGIAKKNLDRIFDPFFTTREVGQGTGLGLSLCHGIVAEHNGKIYAESKPGKGATFIVELPVVTEAEQPKPSEPVVEQPEKVVKAKILVVDDEKVIMDLVKRVLAGEGYEVETVDNATDALKKIEGKRYNLVLIDIKMPGMDGVELYKRIQKIAKSLARRVIFITGDIMGADTEKFLSETKVAHIDKPFDAEQLSREVRRALTAGR